MTAINAFLRRDRGFLMADSAFYSAAGEPKGFGSKIVTIPKLHAAIASRGFSGIAAQLAPNMALRYEGFDDMIDKLEADVAEWDRNNRPFLVSTGFEHFELHVMGWSEKDARPKHFIWCSDDEDNGDIKSRELYEVSGYITCPALGPDEAFGTLHKLGVFVARPDFTESFDPRRDGVQIMMAQRRDLDELDGHEENGKVCIVGGHVEVAEISEEGIAQRILHRWADQAGVFVEPEVVSPKDVLRSRIKQKTAHEARKHAA